MDIARRCASFMNSDEMRRCSVSSLTSSASEWRPSPTEPEQVVPIEAVKLWNEPNNKSHWNFDEIDKDWVIYADLVKSAATAIRAERPELTRVLGGMSPIDTGFLTNMRDKGVLDHVDAVAIHGFPLDWNHWQISEWPSKVAEIRATTDK